MRATLKVLEDNRKASTLMFRSLQHAKRFFDFTYVYFNETGCGNGHSAYWPCWRYVPGSRFLPLIGPVAFLERPLPYWNKRNFGTLEKSYILKMHEDILRVRFATNCIRHINLHLHFRNTDDGLEFCHDPFPSPKKPKVGDMYRVPREFLGDQLEKLSYSEGRVVEDMGSQLKLVSFADLRHKAKNPKIHTIAAEQVIKINDWLSEYGY